MTYDYKRLCNELLSYLYQCNWPDAKRFYALVERARAALAEPETTMPKLPLAARAALDAAMTYSGPAFEPLVSKMIAASIRVAVDQVLPLDDDPEFFPGNCCERVLKQEQQETRDALLGIANALEAQ